MSIDPLCQKREQSLQQVSCGGGVGVSCRPVICARSGQVSYFECRPCRIGRGGPAQRDSEAALADVIAAVAEWSFGYFSAGPYSFGFGVSVWELVSGRVVERLLHRCGAFGVDPKRIVIQIATRPLLCQKGARKSVRRLQEAGFRVMLDRFRIEALALLSDPGCSLVRPERVSERDPQGEIRQISTLCAQRSIGVVAPSGDPTQTPELIRQMGATHAFSEQAQEVMALSL